MDNKEVSKGLVKKGRTAAQHLRNIIAKGEIIENEVEDYLEPVVVHLKIGEAIKNRGLTQKDVAKMTGIRPAAISQLARGFVDRLTLDHVARIAMALNISDIRELMTLELESEVWNMSTRREIKEIEEALQITDEEENEEDADK
jgi:transcriptional regulator with XRE-family HTH domain